MSWLEEVPAGAQGSLAVLAGHISSSEEPQQKGKELDLWASAPRLPRGWGRRGTPDFSLPFPGAGARPLPARVRRQGLTNSFPFQPGKPPHCPTLILGCGAWRKRPAAPKGSPPPHPAPGRWAYPWPGAAMDPSPRTRKQALQPPPGPSPACSCPLWTCARAWCGQTLLGPWLALLSGTWVLEQVSSRGEDGAGWSS